MYRSAYAGLGLVGVLGFLLVQAQALPGLPLRPELLLPQQAEEVPLLQSGIYRQDKKPQLTFRYESIGNENSYFISMQEEPSAEFELGGLMFLKPLPCSPLTMRLWLSLENITPEELKEPMVDFIRIEEGGTSFAVHGLRGPEGEDVGFFSFWLMPDEEKAPAEGCALLKSYTDAGAVQTYRRISG